LAEHIPPAQEPVTKAQAQQGYTGTTPPLGQLPPRGERLWVDQPEQLLAAVSVLKKFPVIAVDAEFTQARPHSRTSGQSSAPRLAILQLAVDKTCFVVDTLRLNNLSPLASVIENTKYSILLHGAGADLRVMADRGLEVAHYYDLEATSRSIFGQHESSLAAMLNRAFGYRLDKSLQRTDWTRRPLPPAMIAYAARDAEVTLALYYWLEQHYLDILKLHEHTYYKEAVAEWIEPFLDGSAPLSADMAVAEAKRQGQITQKTQVANDCRMALHLVKRPLQRNRLLRLIADLSLTQLTPDIVSLLRSPASDERASALRALSRLNVKSVKESIRPLLEDPVDDVRRAAQAALRNLGDKENTMQHATPTIAHDGSRSWTVGQTEANDASATDENPWKARLRSMMDKQ
jgi:ribonuclease D